LHLLSEGMGENGGETLEICVKCGTEICDCVSERIRTLEAEVERLKDLLTWHHNRLNPIEYCQVCMDFKEDEKHKNLNSGDAQAPAPSPHVKTRFTRKEQEKMGILEHAGARECRTFELEEKPRRKVK